MDQQAEPELPGLSSTATSLFPVIGIGASAGGLPALTRLLENMPPAPGMALVLVMHLDPDAPSAADRLLQRLTGMPVVQVMDCLPLRPDHVYVIAPGRSLKIEDGQLIADAPQCAPGIPMTINIFFRTLAEAYGERAIGVLLSGMGSDGVAGLASIKQHGGVTIAQLPGDAEENSMPQAAIDSGMVDFVLSAAQIPAKLMEMRDVMLTIRRQGLAGDVPTDPSPSGPGEQDPHEPEALPQALLIGVTNFFRDRDAFGVLEKTVLPSIFHDRKPDDPLRAWVTACSTGEDAYSLAMLLAEHAPCVDGAPAMQVFATDVDERALAVARAGRYPDAIAADVPAERLARFFTPEDEHFRVRRILRDRILFARHDLLRDPAFSNLDLITCRNVLIYLNREVHRHILEMFHCALNPGGYLFLGNAESADLASDLFVAVDPRHRLYQAKPSAKTARRLSMMPIEKRTALPMAAPADTAPPTRDTRVSPLAELHQRTLAQLAPPSLLVNDKGDIVHASDGAAAFLRYSGGEPSTQLLALVLPELRDDLHLALFQASASGSPERSGPIRYRQDGEERKVALSVVPVRDGGAGNALLLVQFDPIVPAPGDADADADASDDSADPQVRELKEALLRAQRNLERTIAQAEASRAELGRANESLQATVDGLRASVGELEIHREETQSRNEELYTVNTELQMRVEETAKANDDLSNLIASTDIATLFLDLQMRIQRYTPQVTSIFNIIATDVGRPLAHITSRLETSLLDEVATVLATLQPVEREARSVDGRDYIVRIHPYRTAYERVVGAVLTFIDISSRRTVERALRESEQRLALAFAALPIGIAIIDTTGRTVMLNEAMRRFMPTNTIPSRDRGRAARWQGWDAAGKLIQAEDFPGAQALRGTSVLSGMQMRYLDDDGREIWTEVRSATLRDNEGNITGALALVIDVDQLKRSEELAQQSARHQAFLLKLSDTLRTEIDADAVTYRAIQMLSDEMHLDRCYVTAYRLEEDRADVTHQIGNDRVPPLPAMFRLSDYPEAFRATLDQTFVVEDDFERQGLSEAERRNSAKLGMRAMVAPTLRNGENVPAWSMVAISATPRHWTRSEITLVEEVAERTWAAIERARARETAALADRRAERILEQMGDAHFVLDSDFRILVVNAAAERLLGTPRAALLGRSHWDVLPASLDSPVGQAFQRVVEEGVEQHFTHHYTGEGRDLHLEVDAYPTDGGGVAVFWRDVTERVRAELALRTSEEKYRALFNEMDEAFAVVDGLADQTGHWVDFLFIEVNAAFMRQTGMPYPVGRTATQLLGTPNPRWAELYGQVARSGEPVRVEEAEMTLGRVFDLNIFRLGGEGSRRIAALFRDITRRKDMEAALRESEARFRALAEASPALVWQIDDSGALNYVNGRCLDVTGTTLDQLRGLGWHGVVHPDDENGYLDAVALALRTREAFQQRVRLHMADGSHHWFESHALPWYASDGQFQGLVGISIDVNQAVLAEEALKTADQRKDEFLATLAHELRNPLAPISNALQFLRHPGGKRRADRLLAMVERQVRQMVRLVDDLMEVTRISRGKVDLRRAPVALADILKTAVETSLSAFEGKHQQLTIEATDEPFKLDADKIRLTQVFANLLNNASKYTPPGGGVWLTARRDGHDVLVTVRDSGMGIEKEQLPLIFEMFSQPHGRNGHTDSGLGIGLAMVRSLVELHGGRVEARSAGPGQGSEFVVRLPLIDCPDAVLREDENSAGDSPTLLAGRRILVVDDNRDAADSLCQLLVARGADARAVYDGRSALEAMKGMQPHAIVLDIGMPGMDGCEVARHIRQDRKAQEVQLIALSGWGQRADRERSRACGFDHHLTKPAELGGLLGILSTS